MLTNLLTCHFYPDTVSKHKHTSRFQGRAWVWKEMGKCTLTYVHTQICSFESNWSQRAENCYKLNPIVKSFNDSVQRSCVYEEEFVFCDSAGSPNNHITNNQTEEETTLCVYKWISIQYKGKITFYLSHFGHHSFGMIRNDINKWVWETTGKQSFCRLQDYFQKPLSDWGGEKGTRVLTGQSCHQLWA